MARVAFGMRARPRQRVRLLSAGVLLGTTALVLMPRIEAAEATIPTSPDADWRYSEIYALSADGRIFIANAVDAETLGGSRGFYHTPDGATAVPALPTDQASTVRGLSGDGRYVVGYTNSAAGWDRAFRWDTDSAAMVDLGLLYSGIPNAHSRAWDVSGDGTRIAGIYQRLGIRRGWVWIEGATTGEGGNEQMYLLSSLDDANAWSAYAISDDGNFAVGTSDGNAVTSLAVRWDLRGLEAGGSGSDVILNLGSLTEDEFGHSQANDVSADGRVVVGASDDELGRMTAFRWVEGATGGDADNAQMYALGFLDSGIMSASSEARAVSRNGNYVVGWSDSDAVAQQAFRWSEETGMESVADWLARHDADVGDWSLDDASAVSDDGKVIAGTMWVDGEGQVYIARVQDEAPSGIMDVAQYNATLLSAGGIANVGEFLTWLPMNGAHHRPLMLTPNLSGDMCAWATGDFAHYGQSGANLALAEAGACTDLAGGAVRLGGSVGTTASWQALSLGGATNMVGQYVLGEMDWQPDGTPLLLSVTGMLGGWQAKIDRVYSNGGATAVSSGQTNALGGVVRVRADWLEAAAIGNTSFNPWASVSFGALHVDGYSESGGPFPARFAAQNLGHADIRIGMTAVTEFSSQTKLSTTLEMAHRTGTAASAVGQVDGLFSFSLGGGTYGQTWGRLGLELDHKVNDAVALSSSVHLATNGRDPTVAISAGIKGAF